MHLCSSSQNKQQPIQSNLCKNSSIEDLQQENEMTPQNHEFDISWLGQFEIDSSYIASKLPLSNAITGQDDLLSELQCFNSKEVFSYNLEDWELILNGHIQPEHERICASIYTGLPKRLRVKIWLYVAKVSEIRRENLEKNILYKDLVAQPCLDKHLVEKDVVRSFGSFGFFQDNGQNKLQSLHRILCAYANFDAEVGYTQGLNFLAGMLLYMIYMEKAESTGIPKSEECEEEAFWTLVYIMYEKDWRTMYTDDTPKLLELLGELERQMKEKVPRVYDHLSQNDCIAVSFSLYFLTLFIFGTPYSFAKRVLEIVLIGGHDALIHITIKLLAMTETDILTKESIEELLPFLKSELVPFALTKYPKHFLRFFSDSPV